jgi:hypothetical protein
MDELFVRHFVKEWPWKKPTPGVMSDALGGVWSHLEAYWDWESFRWVLVFKSDAAGDAK